MNIGSNGVGCVRYQLPLSFLVTFVCNEPIGIYQITLPGWETLPYNIVFSY